ncbi:hypothetical protein CCACVL1_28274 [Corchorus capsularis]|uniref:Uncharacterized protein n=1 Tax=Corchorus capsularis TaxID=210143 RepID=A0A1R3G746_COCAP|nr:hypothetical protein CCACVL1_28274 [Corchorus capsularis]
MIPPFHLSPTEEKLVEARLTGVGMDVADDMRMNLGDDHERKRVPLSFDMTSMVRFKIGSRTILSAVVKSYCDLDLENLDDVYHPPRIIARICDSQAGFWFHSIRNYRTI